MNSLNPPEKKIKFEERQAPPVITGLFVVLLIFVYWASSGTDPATITDHSFKPATVMEALSTHLYEKLLNVWIYGNFSSLNLYQLLGGVYFFAVFGVPVEKRLGPGRFLLVLLLGSTIPWVVQYWDTANSVISPFPGEHTSKIDIMYIGPCLITCAVIGAYMVLAPKKKTDFSGNMPRPRNEIFRKNVEKPVSERYGLNPWTFICAFAFYQLAMHAAMIYLWPGYDVGGVLSAGVSVLIGYGIASFLLAMAQETFKDGPMKLEAIRRYNELVDLDVTPEDAIKGSARAMGLPVDQVRLWVNQNKNRLRVS